MKRKEERNERKGGVETKGRLVTNEKAELKRKEESSERKGGVQAKGRE